MQEQTREFAAGVAADAGDRGADSGAEAVAVLSVARRAQPM